MGRHHDRKHGVAGLTNPTTTQRHGRYGMRGGAGGLAALIPLLGLGVVVAVVLSMWRRKRMLRLGGVGLGGVGVGAGVATAGVAVANQNCATVGFNEKLIAAERLPGVKYREVDVITRKRIPLHEVREIYEGPAQMEVFEGTQREYVAPDVGCATGGVAAGGYAAGYAGQQCTTTCAPVGGIATGGFVGRRRGLRNRFL